MKKITATLLGVVSAFCFSANVVSAVASAEETNNASVVLSETKYKVSDNEDKMLLVTAIQNYENVYEVGYEFSEGYSVGEGATAETTVYYDTITTHAKQDAEDIFGAEYADAKLIIWEVAYAEDISFNAYALEGVIEGGNLVVPDEEIKVVSETRTIEAQAPALPTEDKTLVDKTNLISKTTITAGKATLGNVSNAQIAAEGAYCIKLPADPDWSTTTVTLSVEVGDVTGYDHLEMKFWGLGLQGDTWFLYANGAQIFTAQGWRSWDNPVTVSIPVSAVVNGKLSLTFTQTWQVGDELYIQYIKAIAPEAPVVPEEPAAPTENKVLLDNSTFGAKTTITAGVAKVAKGTQRTSENAIILDTSWTSYTATAQIEVGDVTGYESVEVKFHAIPVLK